MISKDAFINGPLSIAICGVHCGRDCIHVGLAWNDGANEKKIIHFQSGRNIPVEDILTPTQTDFSRYFFNPIIDFNPALIPSISALSELISANVFNSFFLNLQGVVYNGGKFQSLTGIYEVNHISEQIVNCGVFVVGLLKTYDYNLIDWDSWPPSSLQNLQQNTYLNTWFDTNNIPIEEREYYYNTMKEIRGKHIIVSPSTKTRPSPYREVNPLSDQLIDQLLN